MVQPQLVSIEVFMIEAADTEIEVDVLLLDHRLGDVHKVLRALHD